MSSKLISSMYNHLQVTYGKARTNQRQQPDDKWNFVVGASERRIVEWRMELCLTTVQITQSFNKEPILYVDGSYQSQVMVQAFRWSKFPFTCVVPRFKKDLNLTAFSEAVLFLESIEVSYEVMDLDLEAFFNDQNTIQWTQKYSSDSPGQLVAMKVWKELASRQVPVIFPTGIPLFKKTNEGWKVLEFEKDYGLCQFQKDQKLVGVPCFFKWNPELMMGLLLDPTLKALMTNARKENHLTDQVWKEIFQNYFPIVGAKNWTGFEKAEFTVKRFHQATKANFKGTLTAYAFPYADYCTRIDYKPSADESIDDDDDDDGAPTPHTNTNTQRRPKAQLG